jgi:hypothetical protein
MEKCGKNIDDGGEVTESFNWIGCISYGQINTKGA